MFHDKRTYPPELLDADASIFYDAIVVGAGVIGPCVATGLARKGKKVLIVEREWTMPDRIVGELMQPGGLRALRSLGMIQAINNIDAWPTTGYTVIYNGNSVVIPYPTKDISGPVDHVKGLVFDGNDKVITDATINVEEFENDERERGVGFVHGKFLQNLRKICGKEKNVTKLQGNVIEIMRNNLNEVYGVKVDIPGRGKVEFKAHLTFVCDGVFSKFRRELSKNHVTKVSSSFVGMSLYHAELPTKHHGHVILGPDHMPVLVYQISPKETRMLCAYNSAKLPRNIPLWLKEEVQPFIPQSLRPSFDSALEKGKFKSMPNSWLPARQNDIKGMILLGDSLNMRHPLTGGGMAVGLMDVVLMLKEIGHLDFRDHSKVMRKMAKFHKARRSYSAVINTLSIALYALFAANDPYLKILQRGCFQYFSRGGECITLPVSFLAGVLPDPLLLTQVFFSVALYAIRINFKEKGIFKFPFAVYQAFAIFYTATIVFTPYLYEQMCK